MLGVDVSQANFRPLSDRVSQFVKGQDFKSASNQADHAAFFHLVVFWFTQEELNSAVTERSGVVNVKGDYGAQRNS